MAKNLTPKELAQLQEYFKINGSTRQTQFGGGDSGPTYNTETNFADLGGDQYQMLDGGSYAARVGGSNTEFQEYDANTGADLGRFTVKDDRVTPLMPYIAGAALGGIAAFGGAAGTGGAAGLGAGGSDLATSAAWSNGAAGLGGDTLGAVGANGGGLLSSGSGALVGEGLGAFAPTEAAGSSLVGNGMGAFAPGTEVFTVGEGAAGGGGLLSQAGSALGSGSSLLKGAGLLAGAALGSKPTTTSNTNQSKIDPRMDKYIYGDGSTQGILDQAYAWQQANKSGLNDDMRQGLKTITNVASDPSGYQNIARQGQSLMNQPIAGNPFSSGGYSLNQMPQQLKNLGLK